MDDIPKEQYNSSAQKHDTSDQDSNGSMRDEEQIVHCDQNRLKTPTIHWQNWSAFEKYSTYLTICFFTFLATVNASKFTVAVTTISKEFGVSATVGGYQVCFNVLLLGCGNLFWIPLMRVIGKRPVYLMAMPLLVGTNVWSMKATSLNSLLAASIVSGFAASAADATVSAVVVDMFFVHQRGTVMMIFHMALSSGFFIGPLINAYVVQYSSWRQECEWIAIAAGVAWVVAIFTIRETTYLHRDVKRSVDTFAPKKTFFQCMGITSGYNPQANFFRAFGNTVAIVSYPGVLWPGCVIGVFVGWNIVVQLTSSRTFTKPPYGWKVGSLGLLSISGFIGAVLAIFFGGKLIDMIATRMTRVYNGHREPEYRLYAIVIPAVIGPIGVLIFGLTTAAKEPWIAPAVGYAMQGFGLTAISNVVATYAIDSYPSLAGEALVTVFVVRAVVGAILALYSWDWIVAAGMRSAFGEMVGIQYFFLCFAVVFLVWGKQIRAATATYGPVAWGRK
ncbi:hypothetical protein BP5796_02149 [Coleophoma crateriformis]|uniref:Major facilitator superfamily (MFS) profile domain-containing protein n=1 Tax=Coleophoma crateriformis TaxID=565419 RepID=A0A3D8SXI0_9HELO|nr:hypothetical protein BP5796_02149 [Coleophoma crateriformis]